MQYVMSRAPYYLLPLFFRRFLFPIQEFSAGTICAVLCSADTSTFLKEKTGIYVKENEKRMAAENGEQFQPWTQNFKRFQKSLESLQRLHTQNPAAGSNVLRWTALKSKYVLLHL